MYVVALLMILKNETNQNPTKNARAKQILLYQHTGILCTSYK